MTEFGWAVEGGSVMELGACLLVRRWSRVGEMSVKYSEERCIWMRPFS
jgi:hypothetical protein